MLVFMLVGRPLALQGSLGFSHTADSRVDAQYNEGKGTGSEHCLFVHAVISLSLARSRRVPFEICAEAWSLSLDVILPVLVPLYRQANGRPSIRAVLTLSILHLVHFADLYLRSCHLVGLRLVHLHNAHLHQVQL